MSFRPSLMWSVREWTVRGQVRGGGFESRTTEIPCAEYLLGRQLPKAGRWVFRGGAGGGSLMCGDCSRSFTKDVSCCAFAGLRCLLCPMYGDEVTGLVACI